MTKGQLQGYRVVRKMTHRGELAFAVNIYSHVVSRRSGISGIIGRSYFSIVLLYNCIVNTFIGNFSVIIFI